MVRTPPQLSPSPTLAERFGLNLWRSRRRADLSQEDLGDLVGLTRQAIGQLELGRRLPRIDTIVKLAAGTGVSTCALLDGMQWRPGRYVDGDFCVEHPAASLRRASTQETGFLEGRASHGVRAEPSSRGEGTHVGPALEESRLSRLSETSTR